jgi:hypothetical protein
VPELIVLRAKDLCLRVPHLLRSSAHFPNCLPHVLGTFVFPQDGEQLRQNGSVDQFQRAAVVAVAVLVVEVLRPLDRLPQASSLQAYLHEEAPLWVVRARQRRDVGHVRRDRSWLPCHRQRAPKAA